MHAASVPAWKRHGEYVAIATFNATLLLGFVILLPVFRIATWIRVDCAKRPAALWGTTPILTLPLLAEADRLLGLHAVSLTFGSYYITRTFDLSLDRLVAALSRLSPVLIPAFRRAVLLWALLRFDFFHYFYDEGLLERRGRAGVNPMELRLLSLAGKRLYLYAYGADVRTRKATLALGEFNCCLKCDDIGRYCICDADLMAENLVRYRRHAAGLMAVGDMAIYVPGSRSLWYWPIALDRLSFAGVRWDGKRPLRVLHAPNHEWAKGTQYLEQAVAGLARDGVAIELVRAARMSNSELMALMAEVDVVADQFLIGWHGYTALEAMALGKVVLCFIRDPAMLLSPDECPIVNADPRSLERRLRELTASTPEQLADLGRAGRRYVERHFSVSAVARRLAGMYFETIGFRVPVIPDAPEASGC